MRSDIKYIVFALSSIENTRLSRLSLLLLSSNGALHSNVQVAGTSKYFVDHHLHL